VRANLTKRNKKKRDGKVGRKHQGRKNKRKEK
jgi:hypothetical protein